MGWLEGMVTGYQNRSHEIEKEQRDEAVAANAREATVYQALLNSQDPEIRAMAATGMLQTTQPRKRAGGLKGWIGEMQGNAVYPKLLNYLNTPQQLGEDVETHVTPPQTAGYLPTLPPTAAPAAQTTAQTTTPGATPPAAQAPLPGPPPAPPGPLPQVPATPPTGAPPESLAAPPPPPDIPQVGPDQLRGALPPAGAARQPESLTTTTRTPVYGLPQAFPTAEETAVNIARAKETGEYQALVDVARRSGEVNPEKWAAQLIASSKTRAAGGAAFKPMTVEYVGADGQVTQDFASYDVRTGRYLDQAGQPLPPDARPATKLPTRSYSKREELAAEKFGKPGEDPVAVERRLTPRERGIVLREEQLFNAEAKLRAAELENNSAVITPLKSKLIEQLNTKWETRNKAQRTMQQQLGLMDVGLKRLSQDPLGATQAVLVTFQKILDPTSVVRESEYDRSAAGLAIIPRIQGMYERYVGKGWEPGPPGSGYGRWVGGGAGVPEGDLKAMAETARQFLASMSSYNDDERQRIEDRAAAHNIDPGFIFGGGVKRPQAAVGTAPPAPSASGAGAAPAEWTMVNGVLHHQGKPYQ
jgi:hypothetical protein